MPTKISWTDEVWNPVTGCTKVSEGCRNCYAADVAKRFWRGRDFGEVRVHPERLEIPYHWKKPRRIFVNSMSDLFHKDVPTDFICKVFSVMENTPHHTFQILTKRPDRMFGFTTLRREMKAHIHMGVSAENQAALDGRIPLLLQSAAEVRWLSCEPLLGPIDLVRWLPITYNGPDSYSVVGGHPMIDWVVVGGESGPNHRPMELEWLADIVRQCKKCGIPVFVKQDGGRYPGQQGRIPDELWLKEFPGR